MKQVVSKLEAGYLYVATGKLFIAEAVQSALSLKKVNKSAHITLITDKPVKAEVFDQIKIEPRENVFPKVPSHNHYYFKAKHLYLSSPYEKTFFLDTDTHFLKDCSHLFRLLDNFDFCAIPAPADPEEIKFNGEQKTLTRINTGVMIHRKSKANDALFQRWLDVYFEYVQKEIHDQPAFMRAFADSECKYYPLPNIYNTRTPFYVQLLGEVHLAHGRDKDWKKLRSKINVVCENRVWDPQAYQCHYDCTKKRRFLNFMISLFQS